MPFLNSNLLTIESHIAGRAQQHDVADALHASMRRVAGSPDSLSPSGSALVAMVYEQMK